LTTPRIARRSCSLESLSLKLIPSPCFNKGRRSVRYSIQFSKSLRPCRALYCGAPRAACQAASLDLPHAQGTATIRKESASVNPFREESRGAFSPHVGDGNGGSRRCLRGDASGPAGAVCLPASAPSPVHETSPCPLARLAIRKRKRKRPRARESGGRVSKRGRKVQAGTPERMEGASVRAPETPPPGTSPAYSGDVATSR
jgi:hypothetical protein